MSVLCIHNVITLKLFPIKYLYRKNAFNVFLLKTKTCKMWIMFSSCNLYFSVLKHYVVITEILQIPTIRYMYMLYSTHIYKQLRSK